MTGRKNCALQVPLVVSYKALKKFSKALYGATEGTVLAVHDFSVLSYTDNCWLCFTPPPVFWRHETQGGSLSVFAQCKEAYSGLESKMVLGH